LDFQNRERIAEIEKLRDEMAVPEEAVVLPLPPRLKVFLEEHDDA